MLKIAYAPTFLKKLKKISKRNPALAEEIIEKIEDLKDEDNHQRLKVHATKGKWRGYYAFSVNYKDRILFKYINKRAEAYLITLGNHSIYQ